MASFGELASFCSSLYLVMQMKCCNFGIIVYDQEYFLCIQVFSISLFWTGAVLCNIVHVIVSGMVFLVLIHGGRDVESMPSKPLVNSLQFAMTKSFGSICYGSLFTAAIRTLRWEVCN